MQQGKILEQLQLCKHMKLVERGERGNKKITVLDQTSFSRGFKVS